MATYANSHLLLRALGRFGSAIVPNGENWSWGVRVFIGPDNHTEAAKTAFLNTARQHINALHVQQTSWVHSSAYLERATCAYIGTDGKYEGGETQPTTEFIYSPPTSGGGSSIHTWSTAMAVTLNTELERGRASKGRFYLPHSSLLDSDGRVTETVVNAMRANVLEFLNGINTAARVQWSPASAVAVYSGLGTGEFGRVISAGVGRAPDTQRRRDNRLAEDTVFEDVTTTAAVKAARAEKRYDN